MNVQVFLNRSKAADVVIAFMALAPAMLIYYGSTSPDAAIYFTFFKNFFQRPFSFAPDVVSFGATSPLHVLVFAPVHALFGEYWLTAARILNFAFCVGGMVLLNRALRGGTRTILLLSLLVTTATVLLSSTAQLFETGLAFLFCAWLYHDLEYRSFGRAALVAGSLYLIRPELLAVSVAVFAYIVVQTKAEKRYLVSIGVSMVPALVYHAYMLATSGAILPAGLFTPIITYIQDPASWLERLGVTLHAFWSAPGLIYVFATVVFLFLLTDMALPRYRREMLLCLPLVLVYFIFPPREEIIRYLVPVLPPLFAMIVRYVQQELKAQYTVKMLVVSLVLAHGFGTAVVASHSGMNEDQLLMRDLATRLNGMGKPGERVLMREVQGQYFMNVPCVSLTAAVGDEMLDVLFKRKTMEQFLTEHQVKYIVLSDATSGASEMERRLLADLHKQDAGHSTGDTIIVDGLQYCKVLSNTPPTGPQGPVLASGATESDPDSGSDRLWTSVYEVIGPAPEPQLAVDYDFDATYMPPAPAGPMVDSLPQSGAPTTSDSTAVTVDTLAHQG